MSYAAAARSSIEHIPGGWHVVTPTAVVLDLPKEYVSVQLEGGEQITSDRGLFYLPPGDHRIIAQRQSAGPFSASPKTGALLSVTGDLTSMENRGRSITFTYTSAGRCFASFTHAPVSMLVDNHDSPIRVMKGYRRFSVELPSGEHTITAMLESTVSYGVDITSFWSSWLIVGFGVVSGAALFGLYLTVRIMRPQEART
jgi:hypothetical protein